jgi:hypothetical protein
MSPRRRIARDDLADFIGVHVRYEIESIVVAYRLAKEYSPPPGVTPNPIYRVAVEAFLLHARNLEEFFTQPSEEKYVRAIDANDRWPFTEHTSRVIPQGELGQVHAMLAHIGESRRALAGKEWMLTNIATSIEATARRWAAGLTIPDSDGAADAIVAECDALAKELPQLVPHTAAVGAVTTNTTINVVRGVTGTAGDPRR